VACSPVRSLMSSTAVSVNISRMDDAGGMCVRLQCVMYETTTMTCKVSLQSRLLVGTHVSSRASYDDL
jgi:hypothetical protein